MSLTDGGDLIVAVRDVARRGRLREAEALAARATEVLGQGNPAAAELANLRGGVAFELGELERAETWFEQAMWLAGEHEIPVLAAKATTNLGNVAHLRGKVVLAGSLYQSALEVYRREDDLVGVARSEHNLGVVERELGNHQGAAVHAENAVAAARQTGDRLLLVLALHGQAETALALDKKEDAGRLLAAARVVAEEAEDALGLAEAGRLEALLAYAGGRYSEALNGASSAYEAATRLEARYLAGECAFLVAQVCRKLSRQRTSDRFRRRAETLFQQVGAVPALARVEETLGK